MADAFAQTWYRVRRKVFKIFGGAFHIYDRDENVIAFSKQAAFRLKEDIRVFSDEALQTPLLTVQARQIVDFSAAYDVVDAREGRKVGGGAAQGLVVDPPGLVGAPRRERPARWQGGRGQRRPGAAAALPHEPGPAELRRGRHAGRKQADLKQRFNPFVYKLEVDVDPGSTIDRRLIMAAAILIAAVEGRQG